MDEKLGKNPIESLTKDEILVKYKQILGIAKKAKQAKDELTEENRKLKIALTGSDTMKEMLQEFTENKLALVTQLGELQRKSKADDIEKESLKRQSLALSEDNESLLEEINRMEDQLKQVNILGIEQKKHLGLLELEVNKLKEAESFNANLQYQVTAAAEENKNLKDTQNKTAIVHKELSEKYSSLKQINSEQRKKFNALKDRFVEVHRKLKQLKECKRVLLETQHEYSDAVSKWQQEIISASGQLCAQMNALKKENDDLLSKLKGQTTDSNSINVANISQKLEELQRLSAEAFSEQKAKSEQLNAAQKEIRRLKEDKLTEEVPVNSIHLANITYKLKELQRLSQEAFAEQIKKSAQLDMAQQENERLKERLTGGNDKETDEDREETVKTKAGAKSSGCKENDEHCLECKCLMQELQDLKNNLSDKEENYKASKLANDELKHEIQHVLLQLNDCQLEYTSNLATKSRDNDEFRCKLKEQVEKISVLEFQNEAYRNEKSELVGNSQTFEREKLELLTKLSQLEAESKNIVTNENSKETTEENISREDLQELHLSLETRKQENLKLLEELRQYAQERNAQEKNKNSENTSDALQVSLLNFRQSYDELQTRYEQKEREHTDLLGEMRELNEALKARDDVISRQQEKHQELSAELNKTTVNLKKLEERLNESERSLGSKDERVKEITYEIDMARIQVDELTSACAGNEEQIRALSEELQTLRNGELSNVDTSDILSTSTISRAEELSRLREVDESFEEKYNKLRGLAVKLKRKLQEQTSCIAEMEKQQQQRSSGQRDLEECRKKTQELESEREHSQKIIDSLKVEIQKLRSSRKQANVLNLEIEAAEKSLSEVSAKLTTKTEELATLRETHATKENTITQLRKEIAILEASKESECKHAGELKTQIDRLQVQIKDAVHGKQTALLASKELEQTQERLKLEIEESRLQLAASTSKHEVGLAAALTEQEQLSRRLMNAEERLNTTTLTLKSTENALHDLRIEYVDYKVKAQAILRKNQNRDTCKERELEEELCELRAIEKQLQTNVAMHASIIAEGDKEISLLRENNENLQRRITDTINVVEELRDQNDQLALENQAQLQVAQESLRNHRQQIENLDKCHKEQLHELEVGYARQIELLKGSIEHKTAIRMPPIIGAVARTSSVTSPEQGKIDFLLMEREDAEGSEEAAEVLASLAANRKISNASRRSQHDFMPLDELLNSPMNVISDTVTTITSTILDGGSGKRSEGGDVDHVEQTHVVLYATKERLQIQESRVRHLTALLSENEQDLAKLTQMNDMLKEELRRQERAEEREKHMHNSEYLKNIIIKFLTLSNGDERTRLVPVLNTILKLNRNETEMLNCVAKGQKVSTDGSSSRGWGNLLPSWGSGGNNN